METCGGDDSGVGVRWAEKGKKHGGKEKPRPMFPSTPGTSWRRNSVGSFGFSVSLSTIRLRNNIYYTYIILYSTILYYVYIYI